MSVNQAAEVSDDFPRYFLVKMPVQEGFHYIVCEAVISVNGDKLPDAVKNAVQHAFRDAARGDPGEVIALPNPGGAQDSWIAFQMSKPPPPPSPVGGG